MPTTTQAESPPASTSDCVADFRRRFLAAIDAGQPSPAARRWRASTFERGLKFVDEVERRSGPLAGKRVLDIGGAHGGYSAAACARGALCTCADMFDYDYARLTQILAAPRRFDTRLFDCTNPWPFADHSFDVVMCLAVIEHVQNLDAFFSELVRVLRPDGIAILDTATALRGVRRDPLYQLPLVSLLPTPLRRAVAVHVFRRQYEFQLSGHTFYSAGKFKRYLTRRGCTVQACKYADSPLQVRLGRWPLGRLWQALLRHFAFDFVVIRPRISPSAEGRTPRVVAGPTACAESEPPTHHAAR